MRAPRWGHSLKEFSHGRAFSSVKEGASSHVSLAFKCILVVLNQFLLLFMLV